MVSELSFFKSTQFFQTSQYSNCCLSLTQDSNLSQLSQKVIEKSDLSLKAVEGGEFLAQCAVLKSAIKTVIEKP